MIIDIERRLARRIRAARLLAGLTLNKTAAQLGVSTQQMHKYETGMNKINTDTLWNISCLFRVNIEEFFSDRFFTLEEHEICSIEKSSTILQYASSINDDTSLSILVYLSTALISKK